MSTKSRILVVGGGGVGTISALNLEQGGLAVVTLVLRSNFETVAKKGFTIKSVDHGHWAGWRPLGGVIRAVPSIISTGTQPFDYIICCTKSIPDVAPYLADTIRPGVTPGHTVIVLIQNGLNIEQPILAAFPSNICLSGVSFCGAEESPLGEILHNDADRLEVGAFANLHLPLENQQIAAEAFVTLYQASGKVKVTLEKDVVAARWRKLVFNAVYNPICALTDLDTSRLRLISGAEAGFSMVNGLIRPAMREIQAAALSSANVRLESSLIEKMIDSDPIESFIMPSMQQDVRKKRYIEVESILGEALREGEAVGVAMPIIKTLYHLCKALQFRTKEGLGMFSTNEYLNSYTKL
ncbi:2-dehydropantoate 2-reductase [Leptodontidium sp. 2 PMI_412]|nr:2-dehydropantoate 2-reductase [Leptodontidium sp. 2 PMI_412]